MAIKEILGFGKIKKDMENRKMLLKNSDPAVNPPLTNPKSTVPKPPVFPKPVIQRDPEKAIKTMIVTEEKKKIIMYQMGETDIEGFNNLYEAIGWIECVFGEQEIELVKQEIKKKIPPNRPWRWESKGMENPYEALGFLTFECRPEKLMGMALSLFRTPEEVLNIVQQKNIAAMKKRKEEERNKTEKGETGKQE